MLKYDLLGQTVIFEDATERYYDMWYASNQACLAAAQRILYKVREKQAKGGNTTSMQKQQIMQATADRIRHLRESEYYNLLEQIILLKKRLYDQLNQQGKDQLEELTDIYQPRGTGSARRNQYGVLWADRARPEMSYRGYPLHSKGKTNWRN